jgi:hypothetical protein
MNMTSIPGFSADDSVYRRSAYYHVGSRLAGRGQAASVVPAMKSLCKWYDDTYCCAYDDWHGTGACCCNPNLGCECSYSPKQFI